MSSGKFVVRGEFIDEASGKKAEIFQSDDRMNIQLPSGENYHFLDSRDIVITSPGDLIVGGENGAVARLEKGLPDQVLQSTDKGITWGTIPLPIASADTLGGVKVGERLSMTDGVLSADEQSYSLPIASTDTLGGIKPDGTSITVDQQTGVASVIGGGGGMSNPMTDVGDIIVGGTGGTPTKLAKGSDGQVLKIDPDGKPSWQNNTTLSNPMTDAGDIIVGGTDGTPTKLAKGSDGQILKINSGSLNWQDEEIYELPIATADTLGGVKIGERLSMTDGVLSADEQSYSLPVATADTLGGIRPDNETIAVDSVTGVATVTITPGEVNTASNLGTGTGIYQSKTGSDLQFKSIVAGDNISLSNNENEITINASGGGGGSAFPEQYSGNCVLNMPSSGITYSGTSITIPAGYSVSFPNGRAENGVTSNISYTFPDAQTFSGIPTDSTETFRYIFLRYDAGVISVTTNSIDGVYFEDSIFLSTATTASADKYNTNSNLWQHSDDSGTSWTNVNQVVIGRYDCDGTAITSFSSVQPAFLWNNSTAVNLPRLINPSTKFIDITIGATGATYVSPANGWVNAEFYPTKGNAFLRFRSITTNMVVHDTTYLYARTTAVIMPVSKGEIVRFEYSTVEEGYDGPQLRFYYSGAELCI